MAGKCKEQPNIHSVCNAALTSASARRPPVFSPDNRIWTTVEDISKRISEAMKSVLPNKDDWKKAGLRYARLAFLREDAKTCARILRAYQTGEGDGPEEFTRGLYYRGVE